MKIAFLSFVLFAIVFAKHKKQEKFLKFPIHNAVETNGNVDLIDNKSTKRPVIKF